MRRELVSLGVQLPIALDDGIAFLQRQNPETLRELLRGAAQELFNGPIPETPLGDRICAHIRFVRRLHRMPGDKPYFHDTLYKIKTTAEILDPLRVFVSDKEFSKLYIKSIVGDQYNIPTTDIIRNVDDVDAYNFPATCVIKPTHGFGEIILRKDNELLDLAEIKGWFQMNFYRTSREANYKTLKPKVIVEPYFEGLAKAPDYKFFCVNGRARVLFTNRYESGTKVRQYFDLAWNKLPFVESGIPLLTEDIPRPKNLTEMIEVAEKLSAGFSFIRVDLYSDGEVCKAGELTNCHAAGDRPFEPREDHLKFSELLFG